MSEFIFLTGRGHLGQKAAKIAAKHGASLVTYQEPGCRCGWGCGGRDCPAGKRHWFVGPNYGSPFDSRLRDAVCNDLVAAKIL